MYRGNSYAWENCGFKCRIYGEEGNPRREEAPFKIEHRRSRECAYHYGLLDPKDPY